jgi:hypothetical protein
LYRVRTYATNKGIKLRDTFQLKSRNKKCVMTKNGNAEATLWKIRQKPRKKYVVGEKIRIVVEGSRDENTAQNCSVAKVNAFDVILLDNSPYIIHFTPDVCAAFSSNCAIQRTVIVGRVYFTADENHHCAGGKENPDSNDAEFTLAYCTDMVIQIESLVGSLDAPFGSNRWY